MSCIGKYRPWTDNEIEFLRGNIGKLSSIDIGKALNRTPNAVRVKKHACRIVRSRASVSQAHRANCAVYHAKSAGKLTEQPCKICSSTRYVEAHHDDYSRPLKVRWLCRRCHSKTHTRLKSYK